MPEDTELQKEPPEKLDFKFRELSSEGEDIVVRDDDGKIIDYEIDEGGS